MGPIFILFLNTSNYGDRPYLNLEDLRSKGREG